MMIVDSGLLFWATLYVFDSVMTYIVGWGVKLYSLTHWYLYRPFTSRTKLI